MLTDSRFLFIRNGRHGRNLDEIEIPQNANPHNARQHMQPAHKECRPRHVEGDAALVPPHKNSDHDNGQNYACDHCVT